MGVSAKLYISKTQFSDNVSMFRMLEQTIVEEFGSQPINKEMANHADGDYWMMYWNDGLNKRQLNIFPNSVVGGFPAILLDLGANDNSDKLFRAIAQKMGGIFQPNDCNREAEIFQDPMEGNEEWLLKQIRAGIKVEEFTASLMEKLKKRV